MAAASIPISEVYIIYVKVRAINRKPKTEAGIALLISIFVLLLISIVAIALIVSSGTESALAGNYRSSTGVYYAALSGLEEVRGRLLAKNPNSFKNTDPAFLPSALTMGNAYYVINPAGAEVVAPWDPASTYRDTQFFQEYGINPPNPSPGALSVWNRSPLNALPFPGPLYKWVRINAVSEQSLGLDVAPYDLTIDPKLVYYDGTQLNDTNTGAQVLELTALAVLPNGSQKIVQYLAAPVSITLPPFLAALTLSGSTGNGAAFHAPASNNAYIVKGDDQDCSGLATGAKFPAIGVFTASDVLAGSPVLSGIQPGAKANYTGWINPGPDVENIGSSFPANLQKPSQLDAIAQTIIQNADAVVPAGSSATQTAYLTSLGMTASNPMTVVANGDLDVSSWTGIGYGLLLVTGTFTYDPSATWNGIILVIGRGIVGGNHLDFKQINGAMLVAQTRDALGNLLPDPNLGGASVLFQDSMQGNGIRYSSCWIQKAQPIAGFKILSFHEIAQ